MTIVIRAENIGKQYRINHEQRSSGRDTLREALTYAGRGFWQSIRRPFAKQVKDTSLEEFWALKEIGFEIEQGDRVGIIGRNGAGKSTLLKILSRIIPPSTGKITIEGRVASLLEVGTGFHPELTGRENVFLNGAILGMRKQEITRKFDEIVEFAEVEKFLDTPVKHYSSGMYVRLAFAVAAHLEPEILIVDEVLAVGDAQFQKKCMGKMRDVSEEGRTVLFVSHNMGVVTSLCQTAILLQNGYAVRNGPVREIVDQYLTANSEMQKPVFELGNLRRMGDYGLKLKIERIEWLSGLPLQHGEKVSARIHFVANKAVEDVSIGLGFSTLEGTRLLTVETDFQDSHRPNLLAKVFGFVEVTLDRLILAPGFYTLDIGARSGDFFGLDYLPSFTQFEITMGPSTPGCIVRQGAGVRIASEWKWCVQNLSNN